MPIIPNNVDWSATAAWIALIISITGTIAGPLLTSLLNHRHELKMHQLRAKEEEYIQKQTLLRQCISGIGVFLSHPGATSMDEFGKTFYYAYAYLPQEKWPLLDKFYSSVVGKDYASARQQQSEIIHLINVSLKEPPR